MSLRQVVLDTETTGLDPVLGHRVIEIACVEVVNRRVTDRNFHLYLNPDRDSDPGALQVHGLTTDFLRDKPRFREVVDDFLEFVSGSELIIHNAPFDIGFLDAELARIDHAPITHRISGVVDSLRLAKSLHPGRRNSLDALCERYGIDNSARTLHGALVDARLLAEVYLAMTRGQESLVIESADSGTAAGTIRIDTGSLNLVVLPADASELAAHAATLEDLQKASRGRCVWMAAD
jgi:DNA polymerase III subunit epsilon